MIIPTVREVLTNLGWIVHDRRQESLPPDEMTVVLDDVDVEIETTLTYHLTTFVLIEWDAVNPDELPIKIVELIGTLEKGVIETAQDNVTTFKFVKCDTIPLGLLYRVQLVVSYREVVEIW